MEIWLIHNGERTGPFHDYEIRSRIGLGELDKDSPAWHEGLPAWVSLSEIELFKNEFQPKPEPASESKPAAAPIAPPPIPETNAPPKLWRRFWARWMDIQLYIALWWLFLWGTGRNIEAIVHSQWILLTQLIPWVVIEILLIHHFATTPGKWLLGIRIFNTDGSRLNLAESTRRALRVYVTGIGLGWQIVSLVCMGISAFTTKRLGKPMWDYIGNHRVVSKPLNPLGIILVIGLFIIAGQLQVAVVFPYTLKAMPPEMHEVKEMFEKNMPWHLPPRHK
jgi:uncharacterized RDD family membrane protein YckC